MRLSPPGSPGALPLPDLLAAPVLLLPQPDSLGGMSTGHVMGLFDLPPDCFEALHAPGSDSRAVLGWRRGEAVVCSFRGTSSRTNVVTDIKVCLVSIHRH